MRQKRLRAIFIISGRGPSPHDNSEREDCRILADHGFMEVRRRGSDAIMRKITSTGTVTVPVPLRKALKTGTLLGIIHQSGLLRSLFETP